MRVKTINALCRFLDISNFAVDLKKRLIKVIFGVALLSALTIGSGFADVWIDEFDDIDLKGWKRIVEKNPWFASWEFVDPLDLEYLRAKIERPKQEQGTAADFLHWNAHQFQLDKVTVVGEKIRYPRGGRSVSGELCLFLGKRQPSPDFAEGYNFSPEKTTEMQFSENGVYKKGEVKADYRLMFRLTAGDIRVVFDTGKLQLFTQDLLITEFVDDEIPMIDVVGLMCVFEFPGSYFEATISTFSITGSSIPQYDFLDVRLREEQLTTTWGELKRF